MYPQALSFLFKSVDLKGLYNIVCNTAVFSVVTQRFSPLREERCVTTLKTAVYQTIILYNKDIAILGQFCAEVIT